MSTTKCTSCGNQITSRTAEKNGGLCMLCKRGSVTCAGCGKRMFAKTRGVTTGKLCLSCAASQNRSRPSGIDKFIDKRANGDCSLLREVFYLAEEARRANNSSFPSGLILIDPPAHYRWHGTTMYDPRTTPSNVVSFARTGGDDVHFSLLRIGGGISDASPVVMTVPMGGEEDVRDLNIVLGESLKEFLCLGCVHGYSSLEQLLYSRAGMIAYLSENPTDEDLDETERVVLSHWRTRFDLTPWDDVDTRLGFLSDKYRGALRFRKWWQLWPL